jgi:hypothetical protein
VAGHKLEHVFEAALFAAARAEQAAAGEGQAHFADKARAELDNHWAAAAAYVACLNSPFTSTNHFQNHAA